MKNLFKAIGSLILVMGAAISTYAQCDRYTEEIFQNVYVVQDVPYGSAINESGGTTNLKMDIYRPVGDTATNRPAVILAHGGSFYGGDENMSDMVAICRGLAKRGYVAVSINYRLTTIVNLYSAENMIKAVMRAVQDGKGAVRFLRRIEAEGDSLGIDGQNIFFGGTSAGGILAYQLTYMDDTLKLPTSPLNWRSFVDDVGGLEGNSGSAGYSSWVKGAFGYAGALGDTLWLESTDQPFLAMHSENDGTVAYGYGYPLGLNHLPQLYGSSPMSMRADNIGLYNEFYSYPGSSHPPHVSGSIPGIMDSTISYTAHFIAKLLPCNPDSISTGISSIREVTDALTVYPNPSTGIFHLKGLNMGNNLIATVYNAQGQIIRTETVINGKGTLDLSSESKGLYVMRVSDAVTGASVSVNKLLME